MRFHPAALPSLWLCLFCVRTDAWIHGGTPPRCASRSLHSLSPEQKIANGDVETSVSDVTENDWVSNQFKGANNGGRTASQLQLRPGSAVVGPQQVILYDTTLRDGTQGESVSASCADKLKIATKLADTLGVDFVEAGWPGSNPKDMEFFEAAANGELPEDVRSKLVAFGSTRRKNTPVEQDKQLQALIDAQVPTICLVAKSQDWQVTDILTCSLEENLAMIHDTVHFLVHTHGKRVLVDLEHFYDGFNTNADYALQCCEAAVNAGASCLVLCDTNGGSMPWQVEKSTRQVVEIAAGRCTVGIHTHNDCGMAVANSLSACQAGAGLVQGTINGIGERTGNADLCSIIPSLALHMKSQVSISGDQLSQLTTVSRFVDEVLNRTPSNAAPFVGASAFAHKGGLHVAALKKNSDSYQHIDPARVGNEQRILISELSGRQNILGKMQDIFGIESPTPLTGTPRSTRALAILNRIKALENIGYTFEGAEASVHLMILHSTVSYCPPFSVLDYSTQVFDQNIDSASRVVAKYDEKSGSDKAFSSTTSRATIKVRTIVEDPDTKQLGYQDNLQVSDGNGPIDALAKALVRALEPSHPYCSQVELVDYKVRILDPSSATGAATRVLIEFRDRDTHATWTTVSVDRNVISASMNALVDGYEYALIEHAEQCMLCDDDDDDNLP